MQRLAPVVLAAFVGVSSSACNTLAGARKDNEKSGEAISAAARM